MLVHTYAYTQLAKDDSLESELGVTTGVVLRLLELICGRAHHLYTHNLYTSAALFAELHARGFEAGGTLRLNRRGVLLEAKSTLQKGESRAVTVNNQMAVVQWCDKRIVTLHSDSPVEIKRRSQHASGGRAVVQKPESVVEYKEFMGGVYGGDQLLSYYGCPPYSKVVEKSIFLFDAAVVNSYIMYCTMQTVHHLSQE